ncbi:MAG: hypothetical protein ACREC2_07345, partial [Bradyrhizobium sp.]
HRRLNCKRYAAANGRQAYVSCGGARAWACEPARDCSWSGATSHHTTGSGCKKSRAVVGWGVSIGAAWATLQAAQQPSWAQGWPDGSVEFEVDAASSWQMEDPSDALDAPMAAAQHATIGAKNCTANATRTIGRNFRNRRRISKPVPFNVPANHAQSRVSRLGSRQTAVKHGEILIYAAARDEIPHCRWSCRADAKSRLARRTPLPGHWEPKTNARKRRNPKPFHRLLEF